MTANNETLERIKNEVARDDHQGNWGELEQFNQITVMNRLWPMVCERFARAVAIASLKEAAENATTKATYDYSLEVPEWTGTVVDKSSITDEKNIKLL